MRTGECGLETGGPARTGRVSYDLGLPVFGSQSPVSSLQSPVCCQIEIGDWILESAGSCFYIQASFSIFTDHTSVVWSGRVETGREGNWSSGRFNSLLWDVYEERWSHPLD